MGRLGGPGCCPDLGLYTGGLHFLRARPRLCSKPASAHQDTGGAGSGLVRSLGQIARGDAGLEVSDPLGVVRERNIEFPVIPAEVDGAVRQSERWTYECSGLGGGRVLAFRSRPNGEKGRVPLPGAAERGMSEGWGCGRLWPEQGLESDVRENLMPRYG